MLNTDVSNTTIDTTQKQLAQLTILQHVSHTVATDESTEVIIQTVLQLLLDKLNYGAAQIYQLSPSNNDVWLYLELGNGTKPVTPNTDFFSVDETNIITDAIRNTEPIYNPKISDGPYSYYDQVDPELITGSEIATPLIFGQIIVGVLRVQHKQEDAFTPEDEQFLLSLGRLIAGTIRNNRKIQELQDSIQEIRTLYHAPVNSSKNQLSQNKLANGYQFDHDTLKPTDETLKKAKASQVITSPNQPEIKTLQNNGNKELIAPIQLNGETIGVLGLEDDVDTESWDIDDIRLLEEITSQVALAIENSRLIQETQERTGELSILFEATRQLTETIELTQIYEILTTQLINYLSADRCSVLLLNEARTHFELNIAKIRNRSNNQVVRDTASRILPLEDYSSLQQMIKQPSVYIYDLDDLPVESRTRQFMERKKGSKIQTLTRLPLVVRSKLVAFLEIEHLHKYDYTQNELQLAQAIISQVSVAIENAQLFQQTELALTETQNLYEISRAFVESTDIDAIFQVVLNNIKTFGIDRVSISLLDRSQSGEIETVTIMATWDKDPEKMLPVGTEFSAHQFPLIHAFAQPPFHPLISHDLRTPEGQDERMDEAFRQFVHNNFEAHTMFSAPMFLGSEYKGVLSIYTRQAHIYSDQELRIYQTLADQAIIAIERYRLLEDTRRERDRASLLYNLGQMLSKTTTVDEVNQTILNFSLDIGVSESEIFITDGSDFTTVATTASARNKLPFETLKNTAITFLEETGALSLSRQEKITQTKDEALEDKWPVADIDGLSQMEAFVSIPFYASRSKLKGVLTFFHTESFTDDQISTFESIAIQTASTLDTVWLLRQTNLALSETELLYQATTGFNGAQTTDDLLMVLVESITEPGVDFMHIALLPHGTSQLSPNNFDIIASWNAATEEITNPSIRLDVEQFSFVQQLRPNAAKEIHYANLDTETQRNIDQQLNQARTLLSVPLAVGRNWLGVLIIACQTENFVFKVNTINQIFTLAGQAAVVIQNLRLVEETQQNLYNSEILSSLGQQLLTVENAEKIYELALSAIAATEPDRGAAIFMHDQLEYATDLEIVAQWDNPEKEWPSLPSNKFSAKEFGLMSLLEAGKAIISFNAPEDERFSEPLKQLLKQMQIRVMVAVPIWLNQQVNGFILIGNHSKTIFTVDIIRLYEDIARQTSGALENRRLVEEAQYRASQLQTAAEVSEAATSTFELTTLLSQAVDLIRDRFGYYHASIFMVDEYQRYAVVQASTGEIGQQMLAMRHKLAVGGRSIVGTATATGKPRIALDVGEDAVHFNNPLLPLTRSEMAIPLSAQGRVIGALDVQSTKRGAFTQSDITILQSMANQLANAIEAARAFQESKEALEEVRKLHQRYLRDQWSAYLKNQQSISGYRLLDNGLVLEYKGEDILQPEIQEALKDKHPTIIPAQYSNGSDGKETSEEDNKSKLVAPLTLNGDTVIGTVDFELPERDLKTIWDDDTQRIIEAVTAQAAQAIESARLFEQTQVSREEAEALYEVGRRIVTADSEQAIFDIVLEKMLSVLGLKQGGVLLINDDGQAGKLHTLIKEGEFVENPNVEFPVADNLSYQRLIETKQPVIIEDMATDPLVAKVREMGLAGGIASLLLVPIIINDEVIGAVGADSVGKKHIFTANEVNLAIAMVDQLAIALQNRRLIEETGKRAALLQISSDVSRVATSILDQEELMDETVDLIKDRFGFYHVQIFLIDDKGQFAVLHKSTGEAGKKLLEIKHKLAIGNKSVIGQVTHQRRAFVARNTDAPDPNIPHRRNEFLPETQAELAIPLQVGDTLIGALDVQSRQPDAFTDEEISTLETLASQLAIAILNAKAFKEQQETAERLREIDKLKTQFLANMSHELRTPLNSIIGFSRVILKGIDGPLTELQKADLTSIHNSGQHLLGLINNILDLSKIEAGKMELNMAETEIEPIIKTVMSTAIALVKDKEIILDQDVPENLPTIWADATRIRQVVLNLVSNACKFTEEGSIVTRVRADNEKVVFSVSDTGIGIAQEKIASIFEEFTQVDASTTRKAGGTGLGLPISRYFVEMHHGKMWVESEMGKGTTFSFSIPIKPSDADGDDPLADIPEETITPPPETRKLIIAIDDDPGVVTLYKRFLEKQHYKVIGVDLNRSIIEQIKERDPDAILLDIVLPNKDGWSILKELKSDSFTNNIPVIMCSIISDKNRGFSLGATNYLTKPIAEEQLIAALQQLDDQQKQELKVLVVDDQADDILLIRRILEAQSNYAIIEAQNGKRALELIHNKEPDLIILDLNMPQMDGFATIEALKDSEKTRSIPIIIVSAQELTPQEREKLTGQVEALLHKGIFTENELLEDISKALEKIGREVHPTT